jgi:hypothetical protein
VKTVAVFSERDAALDRALTEFQSNVDSAVSALERRAAADPQVVQVRRLSGSLVRVGQLAVVDGSGNTELLLAKPLPNDEGRSLFVVKQNAAGTLTLRPISSAINAAATAALTSVGRYELQVAGGQYWRAP